MRLRGYAWASRLPSARLRGWEEKASMPRPSPSNTEYYPGMIRITHMRDQPLSGQYGLRIIPALIRNPGVSATRIEETIRDLTRLVTVALRAAHEGGWLPEFDSLGRPRYRPLCRTQHIQDRGQMVRWSLPFAFYACIVRRQLGAPTACPAPRLLSQERETLESANSFLAELGQLPHELGQNRCRTFARKNAAGKSTNPVLCVSKRRDFP